jgi:hypothetical protein
MYWWGESWGAPACDPELHVPTPVGMDCEWCDETIEKDDRGFTMPVMGSDLTIYYHQPCFLRSVLGGLAHQQGKCTCYGGSADDMNPVGMTRREEAVAAVEMWHENNMRREFEELQKGKSVE